MIGCNSRPRCWTLALLLAGCSFDAVAPFPHDDHALTTEDRPIEIEVLQNDLGVGDFVALSASDGRYFTRADGAISTAHGSVEIRAGAVMRYTPERDFHGQDRFFYVVGNAGGTARARVTIDVEVDSERFGGPIALYASEQPMQVQIADFNRDDMPDLVVQEGNRVVALVQTAGAQLQEVRAWGEPGCCERFAFPALVADLDDDGASDLVLFGREHSLRVQLTRAGDDAGSVVFEEHLIDYVGPDAIELDAEPESAWPLLGAAADFDGDGELDLAVGFGSSRGLVVHFGMSRGVPRASRVFDLDGTDAMASGDVTGDDVADLVVLTRQGSIEVIHADTAAADGFARSTTRTALSSGGQAALEVVDLDDRGGDEIVVGDELNLAVLHVQDDLELALSSTEVELPAFALADVDADGHLDLIGRNRDQTELELWLGTSVEQVPGFAFAADFALASIEGSPVVMDFDHDGTLDVVVSHRVDEQARHELVLMPGQPGSGR